MRFKPGALFAPKEVVIKKQYFIFLGLRVLKWRDKNGSLFKPVFLLSRLRWIYRSANLLEPADFWHMDSFHLVLSDYFIQIQ